MNFILENFQNIVIIYLVVCTLIGSILSSKILEQIKQIQNRHSILKQTSQESLISTLDLWKTLRGEKDTLERSVSHLEKQVKELQGKNEVQENNVFKEMTADQPTMSDIIMEKLKDNPKGFKLKEIHEAVEKIRGKALAHSVRAMLWQLEQKNKVIKISEGYGSKYKIWRINNETKKK